MGLSRVTRVAEPVKVLGAVEKIIEIRVIIAGSLASSTAGSAAASRRTRRESNAFRFIAGFGEGSSLK
jgi:hypothetical protein